MFSDVLRDLFHSGLGVIRVAAERFFGVPRVTALPTAGADYRGTLTRLEGGAGVADRAVICEKNTGDTYDWNDLGRAALDDRYVNVSGDTMTGDLTVNSGATSIIQATGTTEGRLLLTDSNAASGAKHWDIQSINGVLNIRLLSDAFAEIARVIRMGTSGNIVFNEDGLTDADVRMETDTNANAFVLDASANTITIPDAVLRVADNVDATKLAAFEASGITTATTRTYTLPNQSGGLMVTDSTAGVRVITGSVAYDPPDTANNGIVSQTVTVTGAAAGDLGICSHNTIDAIAGWHIYAVRAGTDSCICSWQNQTGANSNPGTGTARAIVFKPL